MKKCIILLLNIFRNISDWFKRSSSISALALLKNNLKIFKNTVNSNRLHQRLSHKMENPHQRRKKVGTSSERKKMEDIHIEDNVPKQSSTSEL